MFSTLVKSALLQATAIRLLTKPFLPHHSSGWGLCLSRTRSSAVGQPIPFRMFLSIFHTGQLCSLLTRLHWG